MTRKRERNEHGIYQRPTGEMAIRIMINRSLDDPLIQEFLTVLKRHRSVSNASLACDLIQDRINLIPYWSEDDNRTGELLLWILKRPPLVHWLMDLSKRSAEEVKVILDALPGGGSRKSKRSG